MAVTFVQSILDY